MKIIGFLIIGIISGWLAGQLVVGEGFGLLGNLVVGVIGAIVGGLITDLLGDRKPAEKQGFCLSIVLSTIGAVIFLFVVNIIS